MIDGLELYKAIHHAKSHKESHHHGDVPDDHSPPGVPPVIENPNQDSLTPGPEDIGAIGRRILNF